MQSECTRKLHTNVLFIYSRISDCCRYAPQRYVGFSHEKGGGSRKEKPDASRRGSLLFLCGIRAGVLCSTMHVLGFKKGFCFCSNCARGAMVEAEPSRPAQSP